MFDARALHGWLGTDTQFKDWISRRIKEDRFVEGEDFVRRSCLSSKGRGGWNRKDYLITIDMAKELAMVERTVRGRATRRYFIEMEKAAREMAQTLIAQGQPEAVPQVVSSISPH